MSLQWESTGDDWYISFDRTVLDLEHAVSAVAYYRLTGQTRTIIPDIVTRNLNKVLHIVVGQQALPNGTEVNFWLEVTMDDASVVRFPEGNEMYSVMVYR